jgi:hypothetical protein
VKLKETLTLTATQQPVNGTAHATVVLSPDESATNAVLTLGTVNGKLKLKPGKGKKFTLKTPKTIPSTVPAGTYHALIQVTDVNGAVSTIDSGQVFTIVDPVVDLTGSFLGAPAQVAAGQTFKATFLITNSSAANVAAVGNLPFNVDTSADGSLNGATVLKSGSARLKLAPGQSTKVTVTASLSTTGFLVIDLDPDGTVFTTDANLANNVFATGSPITVA